MDFESEFERRMWAVESVKGGAPVAGVAREVGRSRWWVHKWLQRFEVESKAGLVDRSRAPRRRPSATSPAVVAKVLEVRRALEDSEFGGVGAEAIRWELESAGLVFVPSISTIERILRRARVAPQQRRSRSGSQHRLRVEANRPGVWQQADWVGPRWVEGAQFSSLHLVDVGGGGVAAAQYPHQRLRFGVGFLCERAWPTLGIPWTLQVDNQFVSTSHRRHPWTIWTRVCLYFGVELVVSPPRELGWLNHVESFNALWQARTLRRHHYNRVKALQASSDRFCDYYLHRRPHPQLTIAEHGTRYPGQLIDRLRPHLRFPPPGFTVADHQNRAGTIHIPLTRGRLSYLRRVQPGGVIHLANTWWPLPPATEGRCVVATVLTASRRLVIRHDGEVIATHRFPIPEPTKEPYYQPAHTGLYYRPKV